MFFLTAYSYSVLERSMNQMRPETTVLKTLYKIIIKLYEYFLAIKATMQVMNI
jgi:hypothetical protein